MQRPVVTHVTGWPSKQNGSFERQLVVLGQMLSKAGADQHLVFQDVPLSESFIRDAAPCHVLPPARGPFDAGYVRRCADLLKRLGTTHLHAHFGTDAYLAVGAARLAGVGRRYATKHITPGRSRLTASRLRHRALASQVEVFFAVSDHVREGLLGLGVPERKVRVNLIGIDFRRYSPEAGQRERVRADLGLAPEDRLVLVTSHLRPGKGVELMPPVAARLRAGRGRCLVAVAGEGAKRSEIETVAAASGLAADRFRLLGRRDDIPALLSAADAFVLPTNGGFEGLPMGVLEALACGVPAVVTDVSGLKAVLGPYVQVVPPGDVHALAAAVQHILDHPAEATRQAAAALAMVKATYAVERGASDLVSAYLQEPRA